MEETFSTFSTATITIIKINAELNIIYGIQDLEDICKVTREFMEKHKKAFKNLAKK